MKTLKIAATGMLAVGVATVLMAAPASAVTLKVHVGSLKNGGTLPNKYAFCVPAEQGHTTGGPNINPSISWSQGPKGTKSYAIIVYDTDSPATQREKMNKEGETLTAAVPRRNFYHWILVDIPANVTSISEGADSNARVVHGKPAAPSAVGVKGLNDYTKVTATNEAMKGQYYGYDGPCPPWNDDTIHHYHFTVYALSVDTLNLPKDFDAEAAQDAMKGRILAQGEQLGLFTQNPSKGAKLSK
ncbi:MAG TPA: YbhB/YbcL family Raf kinase inhibitor-like protein [Xanthobacteraceae bacterium]